MGTRAMDPKGATTGGVAHHEADLGDVRLHYVTAGSGDAVVLLHGYPKTWFEWRHVIPILAERYQVIVPDLRGLGDSSRPQSGYDKRTVSEDVFKLVHGELGIESWYLAGRDWGAPTAFSLAAGHPENVRKLVNIEAMPTHEDCPWRPEWWHLFHQVPDLPEQLYEGREEIYIRWFFEQLGHPSYEISDEDMAEYMRTWGLPETTRAGLEWYRALPQDFIDNTAFVRGAKLPMPVLGVAAAGPMRYLGKVTENEIAESLEFASDDLTAVMMDDVGHWVPEEEPERLAALLLDFFAD